MYLFYISMKFIEKKLNNFKYETFPYEHIIIDDFLKKDVAEKALNEMNKLSDNSATKWFKNKKCKWEYNKGAWEGNYGDYLKNIFLELNSKEFINKLEKLTGITGLITGDISLRGAGIHRINNGGHLALHTDFNSYHTKRNGNLDRRINLLIYMNKDWKTKYGGQFDLCDLNSKKCIKRINPNFNRCAIFNTTNKSIHGHPEPLNLPKGMKRQSIAVYYYTKNKNGKFDFEGDEKHGTIFYEKNKFDYTDAKVV